QERSAPRGSAQLAAHAAGAGGWLVGAERERIDGEINMQRAKFECRTNHPRNRPFRTRFGKDAGMVSDLVLRTELGVRLTTRFRQCTEAVRMANKSTEIQIGDGSL